ncbi:unnamed protein product [Haemonchus placei]|uniref:Secreted protein n=1 Tax=Haemonchus placei TaxID=6290 RepID=A0A0N4X047_HAEPC|nr:unnamed protein product [Haemonchus placei]
MFRFVGLFICIWLSDRPCFTGVLLDVRLSRSIRSLAATQAIPTVFGFTAFSLDEGI